MLISRGLALGKLVKTTLKSPQLLQSTRSSHAPVNYRCPPTTDRHIIWLAEGIQGIAWWWILWHIWTEPKHLFGGEFEYPDVAKWTDEELGIPPIE